jgi:ATP-dependent Lon protease
MMPGKGRMTVTGNLKDVMKESISAANGYVRSRAVDLGIKPPLFDTCDIHVHVPEGATPKDGPSAGVALATALASLLTGLKVDPDVAMTGEITLTGQVLPIGGLKEKVLGAKRAGIRKIIMPKRNEIDLDDIPKEVRDTMSFVSVEELSEVLQNALGKRIITPVELGISPQRASNVVPMRRSALKRVRAPERKRSRSRR